MKEFEDIETTTDEIMDGLMGCEADEFHEATLSFYGLLASMPAAS